jgi:hypothetical protein
MDTRALCQIMDELAVQTWHDVADSNRLGLLLGEVTTTENILLALKRFEANWQYGFDLHIFQTPQASEQGSGADFEFWLQLGPFGPIHVSYNGWHEPENWGLPATVAGGAELYGCAALSTHHVKAIREKKKARCVNKVEAYTPHQLPWSSLFRRRPQLPGGPPGTPGPGGGPGLGDPLTTVDEDGRFLEDSLGFDPGRLTGQLPNYVLSALRSEGADAPPADATLPRFVVVVRDLEFDFADSSQA